jgi:hypothetical protein
MTKIKNKDLTDHQELINLVDEGLNIVENIDARFKYLGTTDMYDIDLIKYCMYQISILKTAYQILNDKRYIEIFIILRSAFEQYYRILLMSKGTKYAHDYIITEKDPNKIKTVFNGALKEIKKGIKNNKIDNVIEIIPYKYSKIRLIRKGLYSNSKDDKKLIPAYYFEYKNHQPRKVFVDKLQTFKNLEPNGISAQRWIKHHKHIYHKFIRFDTGVKDGLFINNEIDEYGWDRIIVHYNFMSLFTHIDNSVIEEVEGRPTPAYIIKLEDYRKFNHHISELCLLFKNKTKYLYFISDNPHDLDRINFRTNGIYFKFVTGKSTKADHIYYDNPLERLKQMHTSFHELTTGDVFNSPFK